MRKRGVMRNIMIILSTVLIIIMCFVIWKCCEKKEITLINHKKNISVIQQDNIDQTDSQVAVSTYFNQTEKHNGGYIYTIKRHKNYKELEIGLDKSLYDMIVSIKGDVLYKTLEHYIEGYLLIGDYMYIWEEDADDSFLKAVNINTKKVKMINKNEFEDFFNSPMLYKGQIYYTDDNTKNGKVSVCDLNGDYIKDIPLGKKINFEVGIIGIAKDRIYYFDWYDDFAIIESCKIDGTDYKVVADGFKINSYNDNGVGEVCFDANITYDETGFYFLGGKKFPYQDVCKIDFETGEAEVIKKFICSPDSSFSFDVHGKYLYYKGVNNHYVYRMDMELGEKELISQEEVYGVYIADKYLCYIPKDKSISRCLVEIFDNGNLGKKMIIPSDD